MSEILDADGKPVRLGDIVHTDRGSGEVVKIYKNGIIVVEQEPLFVKASEASRKEEEK